MTSLAQGTLLATNGRGESVVVDSERYLMMRVEENAMGMWG